MAEVTLVEKPVQIFVVSHWCDQLEGDRMAKVQLRLVKADGSQKDITLFGGEHQRGDDVKYIHSHIIEEGTLDEDFINSASAGDKLQVLTICGKNGSYKEFEEVEGEIEYEAEVRLWFFQLQANAQKDDETEVPSNNIHSVESTEENTDFKAMWPVLRDNLINMGRIKKD